MNWPWSKKKKVVEKESIKKAKNPVLIDYKDSVKIKDINSILHQINRLNRREIHNNYSFYDEITEDQYLENTLWVLPKFINPEIEIGESKEGTYHFKSKSRFGGTSYKNVKLDGLFYKCLLFTKSRFIEGVIENFSLTNPEISKYGLTKSVVNSNTFHLEYNGIFDNDKEYYKNPIGHHSFNLIIDDFKYDFYVSAEWYPEVERFLSGFLPILNKKLGETIYFSDKLDYSVSKDSLEVALDLFDKPPASGYHKNKNFEILKPDYSKVDYNGLKSKMREFNFLPVSGSLTPGFENVTFISTNIERLVLEENIHNVYDKKIEIKDSILNRSLTDVGET